MATRTTRRPKTTAKRGAPMQRTIALSINLDVHHSRCTATVNHHGDQRECARVMLEKAKHCAPTSGELHASVPMKPAERFEATLFWCAPTRQEIETHGNVIDATERGAEAVAIITVLEAPRAWSDQIAAELVRAALDLQLCAVRGKSAVRSGADYELICNDREDEVIRIECSGIFSSKGGSHERAKTRNDRLQTKKRQLLEGDSGDPGIAVVVDFSSDPVMILAELVVPLPPEEFE